MQKDAFHEFPLRVVKFCGGILLGTQRLVTLIKICLRRKLSFMAGLQSLPPLKALVAFRAAGQHLNFTRASRDLNVTREAVSGQIRVLEEYLGVRLFHRLHRGLAFTEAGQRLFESVTLGFGTIGTTADELRVSGGKSVVSITTTIAFAGSALIARLPAFHASNPGIDIRVIESDECLDLERDEIDLAVRYGEGNWSHVEATHLFDEETFPICSAQMLAENPDLAEMANIPKHHRLHLSGAAHQWEDWHHLLEAAGVRGLARELGGLWFSNYSNVVQAARDGYGIAVGWRHVVEKLLEAEELVNPTGQVFRTGRGFYLLKRKGANLSPAAMRLHDWLIDIFKE